MKKSLVFPLSIIAATLAVNSVAAEILPNAKQTQKLLSIGTVKSMQQGDLMCYVTLLDSNKKERNAGATFELCENKRRYLNKKVRLTYKKENVNDCQSNEPCGKTRQEWLIVKMQIVR